MPGNGRSHPGDEEEDGLLMLSDLPFELQASVERELKASGKSLDEFVWGAIIEKLKASQGECAVDAFILESRQDLAKAIGEAANRRDKETLARLINQAIQFAHVRNYFHA